MIGQACVCHLPTMILLEMRLRHQFYHNMHNRWWNKMLLIADKAIYPELIATQAWYGKICDTLAEWYLNPPTRAELIVAWDNFVRQAMCYKPVNHKIVPERSIMVEGAPVDEFSDPMHVIAKHALKFAEEYEMNLDTKKYLKLAL